MPVIVFIEADGTERAVQANEKTTAMEAAVQNGVAGIDADCGGACACATCHVYVDADWVTRVGPAEDMERAMLEFADSIRPNSRLACQITLTSALDGLVLTIPKK